ncbi:AraC family transcriptional regulator [Urechidicola vernalis]|uniref:AraC family transcriptional regulator n=1 Tax=Urechidicola vernalis TaxID=3075600 RepID=A0ABU2Y4E7_9FLAO|nr:AraC family transcriptional regulator [Urechidicola sp. P050]MDT0553069.1 AraC family transcriptional regulator [Urechidicola sp. P050]
MKLHLVDRSSLNDSSFTVKTNKYPNFLKLWHFHPELELVYVAKSNGTRFIGDNIEKFQKGELFLIGENLPHMMLNDDRYFEPNSKLMAEAVVVHFKKEFLGNDFFLTPEMKHISKLFERAKLGIRFREIDNSIINQLTKLENQTPFEKTLGFLNILNSLSNYKNYDLLSSQGYIDSFNHLDNEHMAKAYAYIYKNFTATIYLKDVADVINMNPASFSRFFKRVNRKTFSRFLNEVRIGYSCKLMIENQLDITSICFESGFNNISNFNRQFKSIKEMSPTEYIKYHRKS